MKPAGLKSKIFLDSGDPAETKAILELLGFLDGQTTNPTLVAKNPYARTRFEGGEKFSKAEIFDFYKQVVKEISALIPDGSVSIEVYADRRSSADELFDQGRDMFDWARDAHVKYPIIEAGLAAAKSSIAAGIRVNMTLCFSQAQAAAVYAATRGAAADEVFVSPFVGRLDDTGENGMMLVDAISRMYRETGDGHVSVLAASVRTMSHFMQSLALGADIITAPFTVLEEWGKAGRPQPSKTFSYDLPNLKNIPYQKLELNQPWTAFDITHPLTDKGVDRFASDWNALIA
jgi:transaldolase